jgi:hypothetical protein
VREVVGGDCARIGIDRIDDAIVATASTAESLELEQQRVPHPRWIGGQTSVAELHDRGRRVSDSRPLIGIGSGRAASIVQSARVTRFATRALQSLTAITIVTAGLTAGFLPAAHSASSQPESQVLTYSQLIDVAMVPNSSDAWAIGFHMVKNNLVSLILHRHNNHWGELTAKQAPKIELGAIAVASKKSIWAVGSRIDTVKDEQFPVIEHSKGRGFKPVIIANAPSASLDTIAASSTRNVWAGGYLNDTKLPYLTHWNGHRWKTVAVPGAINGEQVLSISTTGPTNAWAVADLAQDIESPYLLHWNGKTWRTVAFAAVPALSLGSVSTTSNKSAFAVGEVIGKGAYVMHWNGHKWSSVPVHGEGTNTDPTMASVAAVGTGAFAVGYDETDTGYRQVAMRITASSAKPMTAQGGVDVSQNQLLSVAANTKGAVAVGYATKNQATDLELVDTLREKAFVRQTAPS